jgi:hypothetical protein
MRPETRPAVPNLGCMRLTIASLSTRTPRAHAYLHTRTHLAPPHTHTSCTRAHILHTHTHTHTSCTRKHLTTTHILHSHTCPLSRLDTHVTHVTPTGHFPDDPYASNQTFTTYPAAAKAIDILAHIMTGVLPAFYRMAPADGLLGQPAPPLTFCLAEQGAQYLVYSDHGTPFFLDTNHDPAGAANYNITWFDPISGASHAGGVAKPGVLHLTPPSAGRHWVAVLLGGA